MDSVLARCMRPGCRSEGNAKGSWGGFLVSAGPSRTTAGCRVASDVFQTGLLPQMVLRVTWICCTGGLPQIEGIPLRVGGMHISISRKSICPVEIGNTSQTPRASPTRGIRAYRAHLHCRSERCCLQELGIVPYNKQQLTQSFIKLTGLVHGWL